LLLARLFTKPSNLIVMDEPTNDLDLETLELLEEKLVAFDGTLLLVSHDRAFLDNVVTSVFVLDGSGKVDEFVGGYTDWMAHVKQAKQVEAPKKTPEVKKEEKLAAVAVKKKKLSFKEQQELDKLPELIDELETKQAELNQQISAPEFYKKDQAVVAKTLEELKQIDAKLEQVYKRWDELEALTNESVG
jgi:ATP-binding cassette subfamily F protein uup